MKTVHVPTLQVDDELSEPHPKEPDSGYPDLGGLYKPFDYKQIVDYLNRSTDNFVKYHRKIADGIK